MGCSSHTGPSVHLPSVTLCPDSKRPGASSAAQAAGQWALWRLGQSLGLGCGLWPGPPQKAACGRPGLQPEIGPAGHRASAHPPWAWPGDAGICRAEGRRPSPGKQVYFGAFGRQGGKLTPALSFHLQPIRLVPGPGAQALGVNPGSAPPAVCPACCVVGHSPLRASLCSSV